MKKRISFTLIELLVVIIIIGILASLLMPVISSVRTNAQVTKCKAEMKRIEIAVLAYEADYGLPPFDVGRKVIKDNDFKEMLRILGSFENAKGNTRHRVYWEAPAEWDEDDITATELKDPWGKTYRLYWDHDSDGKISPFGSGDGSGSGNTIRSRIGIVSAGPRGSDVGLDAYDKVRVWDGSMGFVASWK